jgi:carboxymethylenebutenolidase
MKAPLLLLVAGADGATTPEASREFEHKLSAAGVPHEEHIFDRAPHSFFDRGAEQWKHASDEAWRLILDFVKKHS